MRKNHLSGNMKRILAIACAAMVAVTSVPANSVVYASETGSTQVDEQQVVDQQVDDQVDDEQSADGQKDIEQDADVQEDYDQETDDQETDDQETDDQMTDEQMTDDQETDDQKDNDQEDVILEDVNQEDSGQKTEEEKDERKADNKKDSERKTDNKKTGNKQTDEKNDIGSSTSNEIKMAGTDDDEKKETPATITASVDGRTGTSPYYFNKKDMSEAEEVVVRIHSDKELAEGWKYYYKQGKTEVTKDGSGSGDEFTIKLTKDATYSAFKVIGKDKDGNDVKNDASITGLTIRIDTKDPSVVSSAVKTTKEADENGKYTFNESEIGKGVRVEFTLSESISKATLKNNWKVYYDADPDSEDGITKIPGDPSLVSGSSSKVFFILIKDEGEYQDFSFDGKDNAGNDVNKEASDKGPHIVIVKSPVVSVGEVTPPTATVDGKKYYTGTASVTFNVNRAISEDEREDWSVKYGVDEDAEGSGTELSPIEWAEDGKSFTVKISGEEEKEYKDFSVFGTDSFDNPVKVDETVSDLDIVVDKTGPTAEVTTDPAGRTVDGKDGILYFNKDDGGVELVFNLDEAIDEEARNGWSVKYGADEKALDIEWTDEGDEKWKQFKVKIADEGEYSDFTLSGKDNAGNPVKNTDVAGNLNIVIDKAAPVIESFTIDPTNIVDGVVIGKDSVVFTFLISDSTGVKEVQYCIAEEETVPEDAQWKNADLKPDAGSDVPTYTFEIVANAKGYLFINATDLIDNSDPASSFEGAKSLIVENLKPAKLTITDDGEGQWRKDHTFSVSANDKESDDTISSGMKIIRYSMDGGEEKIITQNNDFSVYELSGDVKIENVADGERTFTFVAEDFSGNVNEKTVKAKFDNMPPKASVKEISEGYTERGDGVKVYNKKALNNLDGNKVKVTFSVMEELSGDPDNWSVNYKLDGEEKTADTNVTKFVKDSSSEDGVYTAIVEIKDDGVYSDFKVVGADQAENSIQNDDSVNNLKIMINSVVPNIMVTLDDQNKNSLYHKIGTANITISGDQNNNIKGYVIQISCGEKMKTISSDSIDSDEIEIKIDDTVLNSICSDKEGAITIQIEAKTEYNDVAAFTGEDGIRIETTEGESTGTYYYDAVAPELLSITSTPLDTETEDPGDQEFNIYDNDEEQLAYVSAEKVIDEFKIKDGYIESIKISYNKGSVTGFVSSENVHTATVVYDGEGEYSGITVEAKDKAGNTVVFNDGNFVSSPESVNAVQMDEGNKVKLSLGKYLDITSPKVTLAATERADKSDEAPSYDKKNNIAYYNTNFTEALTVTDNSNVKDAPLTAKCYQAVVDTEKEEYYEDFKDVNESTSYHEISKPKYENDNTKATYSKKVVDDGIYHLYIEGTDKAGNRIEREENQLETGELGLADFGNGYMSYSKVLDTVAPDARFVITVPTKKDDQIVDKIVFDTKTNKDTLSLDGKTYDPFQKKTKAKVAIREYDPSLINYTYVINSTEFGETKKDNKEVYGRILTDNKEFGDTKDHIVTIEGIRVTDRAGNELTLDKSQPVVFDNTAPTEDFLAPKATIKASSEVSYHYENGPDLFKDSVDFTVTVTDPNKNKSSSGLRYYSYRVKVDNKTIEEKRIDFDLTEEQLHDASLIDNLTTKVEFPISVSNKYQSNNMVIEVDAMDQSKNEMKTFKYYFGIDSVGPKVTVSYNNNSAENGKYFKANRIATIRIVDRNIDDEIVKKHIKTKVDVPTGFDHKSDGGNGGNDQWIKKLYYTTDGDYTLSLEGMTDALGNKAKIDYVGTAPQAFTIDKTAPVINLSFDNNNSRNGKYYKDSRTATVKFIEHNFDKKDVKIATQKVSPGSYTRSGDVNTTHLSYTTDGDYTITVDYTDLAGNKAKTVKVDEFTIDKTAPIINITFDNNSVQNGKYYKDPRTASVEITEHNFRASDASIQTQVSPGGFSNNNGDRHVANVYYGTDGVYTMTVNYTDLAGNPAKSVSVDEFVVDRTVPVITVTFDNNSAQNGKYYKDPRTATISIREHNFRESEVRVAPGYSRSGFGGGGDDHSASMGFSEDGVYAFVVNYTDLAGNPAQAVPIDEFVIDRTKPVVKFIVPSKNDSIFQGDIAPQIEYSDTNIDRGHATINLKGMKKSNALEVAEDSFDGTKGVVRFENLKKVRENDDIYTATAIVTDFAGNEETATITFSVNRFGSTYDYNSDEATGKLVEGYYTNAEGDVILREVNVNPLTEKKLTLYKDGDNRVLVEGTDYKVEEKQVNGHYEYIYTIYAKNFEEEGNYNIIATSKDKAGNTNSNSSVKGEEGGNEVPLRFAVDKTEPKFEVTGADLSKDKFRESQITLDIRPLDNMNAVAKVRIRVLDKNGNLLQPEFVLEGKELAEFLEQNDGKYTLTVDQNTGKQTIEMIVTDAAGNETKESYEVLVTPNLFYQYINTPPAVAGTIAGVGGLLFFLIWKRKKDQDEENAA